jgi:hypothetical protein
MNIKTWKWMGVIALALIGLAGKAQAGVGTSSYLNIDVTISAALSVAVDAVNSSTYAVTWTGTPNQILTSPSSATVTNDSGILTERWKLFTNASSLNVSGGAGTWSLGASTTSVGADTFVVQAVFASSNTASGGCAAVTSTGTWSNLTTAPILTTSLVAGLQYTTAGQLVAADVMNNGTASPDVATNSGSMLGGNKRALCWRIITPTSTSTTQTQNVQIMVAAY